MQLGGETMILLFNNLFVNTPPSLRKQASKKGASARHPISIVVCMQRHVQGSTLTCIVSVVSLKHSLLKHYTKVFNFTRTVTLIIHFSLQSDSSVG